MKCSLFSDFVPNKDVKLQNKKNDEQVGKYFIPFSFFVPKYVISNNSTTIIVIIIVSFAVSF